MGRRFALAEVGRKFTGKLYSHSRFYGMQHSSGKVTIWHADGQPRGCYLSIDSAAQRLAGNKDLWLVWLEPAATPTPAAVIATDAAARAETRDATNIETWVMTAGFTAHGQAGATVIARELAARLADFLPGFEREYLCIARESDPGVMIPVFCERNPTCVKQPGQTPPCNNDDGPITDEPTPGAES